VLGTKSPPVPWSSPIIPDRTLRNARVAGDTFWHRSYICHADLPALAGSTMPETKDDRDTAGCLIIGVSALAQA
jgi:hypothetical protein